VPTRIATLALAAVALAGLISAAGCAAPSEDHSTHGGAAVYTTANPHGFRGTYLDDPYQMPNVTLTDTAGQPFTLATGMNKPVTLVVFIYTSCPDICPTVLADLASALRRADPAVRAQTDVLVITTDPARDTTSVLRDYLDRFDPSFVGLTGSLADIKKAAGALGVALEVKRLPSGGFEIGHSAQVIGFGPDGTAHLVWMPGTPVGDVRHDIEHLAGLG
jgi:protein SCO1/2